MSELPRKAVARTARLAGLPLSYAGRSALGLGRRLGGAPAEQVLTDVQQRTAEQLFRTLGELKGGAMKFGQALSIFEAALPDELAAPYREHLVALQDSAPPMPSITVRQIVARDLGADWAEQLVRLEPEQTAAASIGQVHRGRWHDGREVAVKVQYPGAEDAIRSDLRQLSRAARALAPAFPAIDVKALLVELQTRVMEELDYTLEAAAQEHFATAYADDPHVVVPRVVAQGRHVLITEWLESPGSLARVIGEGTAQERNHYGKLLCEFLFSSPSRTGMLHADPHPGNFRTIPATDGGPGGLGVLDYGAVARLPEGNMPRMLGTIIRVAAIDDYDTLIEALRAEGVIRERIRIDADALRRYLGPFMEPAATAEFTFSRTWMREQFERVRDPRGDAYATMLKLNVPPEYLLIHRTWTGGIAVLSQLGATVPFRGLLEENLPGFAG